MCRVNFPFVAASKDRHLSAGICLLPDSINEIMVCERPTRAPISLCERLFAALYDLSCSMASILRPVIIAVKRVITFCEC